MLSLSYVESEKLQCKAAWVSLGCVFRQSASRMRHDIETSRACDAIRGKKFAALACGIQSRDFRTTTSRNFIVIFFLTSLFINSIHQLVAVEDHCKFSMKNGRENRNNGNQEEGEKEKETLKEDQYEVRKGTRNASPKFFVCGSRLRFSWFAPELQSRWESASPVQGTNCDTHKSHSAFLAVARNLRRRCPPQPLARADEPQAGRLRCALC
jgi:hypothetical protein